MSSNLAAMLEQHATLRPYVEQHAPDLVEALWGAA